MKLGESQMMFTNIHSHALPSSMVVAFLIPWEFVEQKSSSTCLSNIEQLVDIEKKPPAFSQH
jgi:hypothetical protein